MKSRLFVMLGAMMFLQYAVWGAWTPLLSATLGAQSGFFKAPGAAIGGIYGILWLAFIFAPIAGQLVDRYMPGQVFLGIAAAICTVSAWMMSQQQTLGGISMWMWVWAICYAPTIGVTNSIVFYHLSKLPIDDHARERYFSIIRTAGTIGWIASAFILKAYMDSQPKVAAGTWAPIPELQMTAYFGILLTIVAFLIPNTPPSKEAKDPFAFTKAFSLFKTVPGFTVFMIISFFASTEFQFYYLTTGPFMENGLKIPLDQIAPFKSIAQMAEIVCLAVFTPWSLKHLGVKKTLIIGTLAWPARYIFFAIGQPTWLVMSSMTLHGIGFAFFFVTSYIFVDRIAPKDIRTSAQNMYNLVTLGLGSYLGTMFAGQLQDHFTKKIPDPAKAGETIAQINWPMVFIVPAVVTILCAIAYQLTFKEPPKSEEGEDDIPSLAH